MTEFRVSQGNTWCDLCKIFVSKNSTSVRTHELGTRHKDNVAKQIADIKKENAVKEKDRLLALKVLEKMETQAMESYERDMADMQICDCTPEVLDSTPEVPVSDAKHKGSVTRVQDESLEAVPAARRRSGREPVVKTVLPNSRAQALQGQNSGTQNASSAYQLRRFSKGMAKSSLKVSKRKRVEKSGSNFSEDAAALAARESEGKRIKEWEESLSDLDDSL